MDKVKELVVEKLKAVYDGFDNVKAGYLTLYTDEAHNVIIKEKKMTFIEEFYGELVIPVSSIRIGTFNPEGTRAIHFCSRPDGHYEYDSSGYFAVVTKSLL